MHSKVPLPCAESAKRISAQASLLACWWWADRAKAARATRVRSVIKGFASGILRAKQVKWDSGDQIRSNLDGAVTKSRYLSAADRHRLGRACLNDILNGPTMQDRISESIKSWSWDVVSQCSGERMSNVKIGSGSI